MAHTHTHTHTHGRTSLDEGSARRRDLYLHNTQHSQQRDMHALAWFEPAIPAGERPQTYASERAATWIDCLITSLLLTHCRCRRLLVHWITLTHTLTHSLTHSHSHIRNPVTKLHSGVQLSRRLHSVLLRSQLRKLVLKFGEPDRNHKSRSLCYASQGTERPKCEVRYWVRSCADWNRRPGWFGEPPNLIASLSLHPQEYSWETIRDVNLATSI
jgi:hypothetical protein